MISHTESSSISREKITLALNYASIWLFWGATFLTIRVMVQVLPATFSAGIRFFPAGVILYLLSRIRKEARPTTREVLNSALIGLLIAGINYSCLYWAEGRLASGVAAVLTAMVQIWMWLGEAFVMKTQRISLTSVVSVLLSILGVALVTGASGFEPKMAIAALVLLAGTISFATGTLLAKAVVLPTGQFARSGLQMMFGGLVILAVSFFFGDYSHLSGFRELLNTRVIVSYLYLLIFGSIVAYTSFTWLLAREPASRVGSYAYVNPLVALVLGAIILHEQLNWRSGLGAALIIIGVFIMMHSKKHVPPHDAVHPG